ncbi:MAG: hypothetical protein PHD03_03905 [Bacilli bacterium]|nr:hypothetical protein [Bacilli bacterium]MDD4407289.1 hypothetical protein [Bacilli bacterium]
MKVFINNAIHNGIINYLNYIEDKGIDKIHIFEFSIVQILVSIYGEINIINPFKLGKEESFKKNLMLYGLKESEMEMFIKYMGDYDRWLNSLHEEPKTKLPMQVETIMINMVLLKSNFQKITEKEIDKYNNFFDPVEGDIVKVQDLIVEDKTLIPSLWRRKRFQLEGNITLETIQPELLSPEIYQKYGLSIDEVKKLSNIKIKEINETIKKEETNNGGNKPKFDPRKLVLSSGSGFVDTIVLLSIMATEIMVGLLVAFSFLRS